jgi:hypothetical protein
MIGVLYKYRRKRDVILGSDEVGALRLNKEARLARDRKDRNKLPPASCALAMIEEHAR